jgi:hypothetical protein
MAAGSVGSWMELFTGDCVAGGGELWAFASGGVRNASNKVVTPKTFLMLTFMDLHHYNHDLDLIASRLGKAIQAINHYIILYGKNSLSLRRIFVRAVGARIFNFVRRTARRTVRPLIGNNFNGNVKTLISLKHFI